MTTCVKPIYYHNIIKNDQIKCCILPQEMLANVNLWTECVRLLYDIRSSWTDITARSFLLNSGIFHQSQTSVSDSHYWEEDKKGKKEGQRKRQGKKEEPLPGGIQRFLHSWSVSAFEGVEHSFLCVSFMQFFCFFQFLFHKLRTCFYFKLNLNFQN